ncbi:glucose 1-dehydrogenase [Caldalkalibacillus salinus]|uniref:glucose 1-dehydrogenase n=1 Tax=Caldalkalibacillus salinus TaxID=2803787 RepID=UPI00192340B6|nr:glucose 1-dehydrogenase [Caldalkalibacillus salinus]
MRFQDKVVIVTGAGHGIGQAIALAYAEEGAHVIIGEKDRVTGQQTAQCITEKGGQSTFIQTDVSQPSQIEALVSQAFEQHGRIDILINNAGVSKWASPNELTVDEWDHIINTNLRSVFLCTRETAKYMRQNGGGSVVNLSSTRAMMSEPHSEAYAATKGGIVALTHAMAASFAPDHIQVNCISPGWIETDKDTQLSVRDHAQHLAGRVGEPEDIARACLYLTAEENDFVNGANLVIDGGMTRKMIYEP